MKENPVIQCLDRLRQLDGCSSDENLDQLVELCDKLSESCGEETSGNAAIATKNGGVELICSLCSKIPSGRERALVSTLKAMAALLHGMIKNCYCCLLMYSLLAIVKCCFGCCLKLLDDFYFLSLHGIEMKLKDLFLWF